MAGKLISFRLDDAAYTQLRSMGKPAESPSSTVKRLTLTLLSQSVINKIGADDSSDDSNSCPDDRGVIASDDRNSSADDRGVIASDDRNSSADDRGVTVAYDSNVSADDRKAIASDDSSLSADDTGVIVSDDSNDDSSSQHLELIEDLQKRFAELTTDYEILDSRLKRDSRVRESLSADLRAAKESLSEAIIDATRLRSSCDRQDVAMHKLQGLSVSLATQLAEAHRENMLLAEAHDILNNGIETVTVEAVASINRVRSELTEVVKDRDQLMVDLEVSQSESQKLSEALALTEAENSRLSAELEKLQQVDAQNDGINVAGLRVILVDFLETQIAQKSRATVKSYVNKFLSFIASDVALA